MKTIITTDSPVSPSKKRGASHTLSILVNNEPGVLMRICQVFSRRGFNIDSLVVSEGRNNDFSRMTIGISGDPEGLEQIIKQVSKLIDVIHCQEHTSDEAVCREMILIKFHCTPAQRPEALHIIEHFGGKSVDITPKSMVVMLTDESAIIDSALMMLSQFEIVETVRTGKVVMARGDQAT